MGGKGYRDLLGVRGAWTAMQARCESPGLNPGEPLKLCGWRRREVGGMRGVAVKCIDIAQNSDCEGSLPAPV